MIVTILPSSGNFHAVGYNMRKVAGGDAQLIYSQNMGWVSDMDNPSVNDYVNYFNSYSSRNPNVKKSQFHIAVSCKGAEMSFEELLAFGKDYLREMGYGDPYQPIIAFAHNDTDNNHIHFITSRVAPDGHKIEHSHERRRSRQVIEKLLQIRGVKTGDGINEDIMTALGYSFDSPTQFCAIMSSKGYTFNKDTNSDIFSFFKDGNKISITEKDIINKIDANNILDSKERKQLRAVLFRYRDQTVDKNELKEILHRRMGIDIVFFGREDNPYGYTLVDHRNKRVIKGSSVLKISELLNFKSPQEHLNSADGFIDRIITANPEITTAQLNSKLRRYKAVVKKGKLHSKGFERELKPVVKSILKQNDRIAWVNKFQPKNEYERLALSKIAHCPEDKIEIQESQSNSVVDQERFSYLNDIIMQSSRESLNLNLKNAGGAVIFVDNKYVMLDLFNHKCTTLDENNPSHKILIQHLNSIYRHSRKQQSNYSGGKKSNNTRQKNIARNSYTERGVNREWEIEKRSGLDESDNNTSLKLDY